MFLIHGLTRTCNTGKEYMLDTEIGKDDDRPAIEWIMLIAY